MITLYSLTFNAFQVNTYIIADEKKNCIIIDAACFSEEENKILEDFIASHDLKPQIQIDTHPHIDHILGNDFVKNKYNIPLYAHKAGDAFFLNSTSYAKAYGWKLEKVVMPDKYVEQGDMITVGDIKLKVLYTPGHVDGSISLYNEENHFVIVGDVLFNDSIGRTDLPSGDYDLLIKSIKEQLFTLPEDTEVYPGHGPKTSISKEIRENPFINF